MIPSEMLSRARAILRQNDTGIFIKPGPGQYPHQWNWDVAYIAIGLAHYDVARARAEVAALLRGQWRNGMVPHVVYHSGASDYFPTPEFWQIEDSTHAPVIATSGITQPPLLATAVRFIHERAADYNESLAFVREVYPALLAWHRWFYRARDLENSGLVAIIHPWESGTDNSTRWTAPLSRITPSELPSYERRDMVHVNAEERPTAADYDRFIHLINGFRRRRYDTGLLYSDSPFLVQDVFFNAILYRANEDLRALGVELGHDVGEIDGWLAHTRRAFNERFWHAEKGLYFDYDLRAGMTIEENTCATFIPLFAGLPDAARAQRLVEEHLLNPAEYAPDDHTHYYVPSAAKSSPLWEPRRYWQGPVWVIVNWLIMHGLRRYGYAALAESIRQHTLSLVAEHGFFEYYDPRDGTGCGSGDFSWTAALAIDLALEDESTSQERRTQTT